MDPGIAHRAAIGVIVLATDQTIEYEYRKIFRIDGVALYESRIANSPEINPVTLARMEQGLTEAAAVIRPGVPMDVVAYGCTSGTVVIGEETVFRRIREAWPQAKCTTPITGAIAGFKAMGVKRIALLTPYIDSVNRLFRTFVQDRGIEVPVIGSFNHENDNDVARISQDSIRRAALELGLGRHPAVDAVFVSCTSIRVAEAAKTLESELGKPVTSSNHAMAWHALRLAGINDPMPEWGRLFTV
ncbi:MAG TPA: Asp/Glu racemase [Candidatus Binatia bacterium]|nr:Asp/Glu racemase [Candidatus Binatia bacterium]